MRMKIVGFTNWFKGEDNNVFELFSFYRDNKLDVTVFTFINFGFRVFGKCSYYFK